MNPRHMIDAIMLMAITVAVVAIALVVGAIKLPVDLARRPQ